MLSGVSCSRPAFLLQPTVDGLWAAPTLTGYLVALSRWADSQTAGDNIAVIGLQPASSCWQAENPNMRVTDPHKIRCYAEM